MAFFLNTQYKVFSFTGFRINLLKKEPVMARIIILVSVLCMAKIGYGQYYDLMPLKYGDKCYLTLKDYMFWSKSSGDYNSPSTHFALDMATSDVITEPRALELWNLGSINTQDNAVKVRVAIDTKNKPGSIAAKKIKGFDDMLDREEEMLKKRKKQDKENYKKKKVGIFTDYNNPAAIRYDTINHRIFLIGSLGISYVHEDSLNSRAHQVMSEVPGLRLHSVASPDCHRYIFLVYTRDASEDRRSEMTISRVFDTYTLKLLQLPEFGTAKNPAFTFCPTGDYVLVHGKDLNFGFTPGLINLKEWKFVATAYFPILNNDLKFFLYRNLLYIHMPGSWVTWQGETKWLCYLSVINITQNSKEIFRCNKKR